MHGDSCGRMGGVVVRPDNNRPEKKPSDNSKPEDPIFLIWQHAEREYAEGRAITLDEFASQEGLDSTLKPASKDPGT